MLHLGNTAMGCTIVAPELRPTRSSSNRSQSTDTPIPNPIRSPSATVFRCLPAHSHVASAGALTFMLRPPAKWVTIKSDPNQNRNGVCAAGGAVSLELTKLIKNKITNGEKRFKFTNLKLQIRLNRRRMNELHIHIHIHKYNILIFEVSNLWFVVFCLNNSLLLVLIPIKTWTIILIPITCRDFPNGLTQTLD